MKELLELSSDDIQACIDAYEYLQNGTRESDTEVETEHIRRYYKVLHPLLAIADIEKMYIPPMIDPKQGLYGNQLLHEKMIIESLNADKSSHLLDIGCGRGRISHYASTLTGSKVSGFNIDGDQIENAKAYAKKTGFDSLLDFQVGDHHKRFNYSDNSFDGAYSFQAVWPFFKQNELDFTAREIYRVLKPGAKYACGEYLLTPFFDWNNEEHVRLHSLFLPTLAATQSNYPQDVTSALERAGFKVLLSAPSVAPTWPLTDQKTDLFILMRSIVRGLVRFGVVGSWFDHLISNLLLGGVAWADAEKAKLADLNWQITVQKPFDV